MTGKFLSLKFLNHPRCLPVEYVLVWGFLCVCIEVEGGKGRGGGSIRVDFIDSDLLTPCNLYRTAQYNYLRSFMCIGRRAIKLWMSLNYVNVRFHAQHTKLSVFEKAGRKTRQRKTTRTNEGQSCSMDKQGKKQRL